MAAGHKLNANREKAVRLRGARLSYQQIGNELGISKQHASQMVRAIAKAGLINWSDQPLGIETDEALARLLQCEVEEVRRAREARKLRPAAKPPTAAPRRRRGLKDIAAGRGSTPMPPDKKRTARIQAMLPKATIEAIDALNSGPRLSAWIAEAVEQRVERLQDGVPDPQIVLPPRADLVTIQVVLRPATRETVRQMSFAAKVPGRHKAPNAPSVPARDPRSPTAHEEYHVWWMMIRRCTDEDAKGFEHYGGRGIKVHPQWEANFATFYEDVGPRPTRDHVLDRFDEDGDFRPENCAWTLPASTWCWHAAEQRLAIERGKAEARARQSAAAKPISR